MQHEINKKLKVIEHIYDANISKNMFIRDLLSNEMFGYDKLLLFGNSRKQQKDTNRFQLQLLLHRN